ncbi:MAG: CHAT domain-containing protein [Phenylobacterium sp.]|uniref:CHAT domain-containing protein n=1 Tax=Phenylobacterium sp. TaxID=1871053 RepID=UPI0027374DA8|nr:CHAT domain-containing protein [Phenylobacterium sp.]MDP3746347.1 CHAT domain-containing protein [Phenylobacterium sp.]
MVVEPDIFYVLLVPDWRPHEVSPFQGLAPGLLDHLPTLHRIVRLPGDVFEYAMPRADRLARRAGGLGGWRWIPFNASSLPDLEIPPPSPIWVMFSADAEVAAAVEVWRRDQVLTPLHVGVGGVSADLDLGELTPDRLVQHCRQSLAQARLVEPDLDIAHALEALDRWLVPPSAPSPLTFASHNVSAPNEMVLLSEGYQLSNGAPVEGETADDNYLAAIAESARQVRQLRNEAGFPRAFLADPPRPDLILFAPAIYPHLESALAPFRAQAPPGLMSAIRLMRRQRQFVFAQVTDEVAAQPGFGGALALRGRELKTQAAAIGLRGASTVAATIRFPPSVNRAAGAVGVLANHLRQVDRPRPVKTARVFKAVQTALTNSIAADALDLIRGSQSGLKIFADAPLEWLPVDGLPLGLRFDVSRINATPGALTFGELPAPRTLYLAPEAFLDFLVVSSFGAHDPIRDHLRLAIEALAETAGVRFRGRFVDVQSEAEMVAALNDFEGPIAIFDMHGSHEDHVGVLQVGPDRVDVWGLRTQIRVPPIVVLSACDTHPADRSHATVANGFIHCGARTVLGTLLPVQSMQAAALIAKLLLRAVVYTRARIDAGRAVPWSAVVGGTLRMMLVAETARGLAQAGHIANEAAPGLQFLGNELILRGQRDWFEQVVARYRAATGLGEVQWAAFFGDLLAGSEAVRYVQVGNPETIVVTTGELMDQVYGALAQL